MCAWAMCGCSCRPRRHSSCIDIALLGWAEDVEVISVTQLPPVADKLAAVKRWLNPNVGDLSVTQVSYLIPSYINNWLEEEQEGAICAGKGSGRSLKIILCTFKSPFSISRVGSLWGSNTNSQHYCAPHGASTLLMRLMRLFITVWPVAQQAKSSEWIIPKTRSFFNGYAAFL